jgi:hypothetical protein
MKGTYSGQPGIDWHLAKEACHFSGIPSECRGELTLINVSNDKVKVRALSTQKHPQKGKTQGKKVGVLQPTHIALSARIPPHSEIQSTASLNLPPDTPPGQYQATVMCGKQKAPIEIDVLAHQEVLIEPSHLRVQGESGEIIKTQISIKNLGNVPLDIRNVGMVWLREKDWIGRTLVYTLRETAPNESLNDFGDRLLHTFHDDMIPPAKIQFEPVIQDLLAAGCNMLRTICLTLPLGIKKGRRYLGFIKINENRIWLEVYCSGSGSGSGSSSTVKK